MSWSQNLRPIRVLPRTLSCLVVAGFLFWAATVNAEPIKLHPDNGHYFLFRGRSTVLITSGEHYGAVLNLDFDFVRYLDVLQQHGFNATRAFSGTYREVPGSFGISGNTLAPATGRFVCPWARSETPGASDGGNKFDLSTWDAAYFDRLRDFITQAGRRGIVVELVFFCTMYDETLWQASPMYARNNVQGVGDVDRHEVYSGQDPDLLAVQEALVRKIVTELNGFDNVYYEICNEPYERGGLTAEWNDRMIETIVQTEAELPASHLIAQGVGLRSAKVEKLNPLVSVLNFHAATPESVRLNYELNRAIADDETGGSDQSDRKYRTEGWEFILSGGGVYSHLDFSFTPQHPEGTAVPLPAGTPGGGGPDLRKQLQVLKKFIESFDFVAMAPSESVIHELRIEATSNEDAEQNMPRARALVQEGVAYAVYVNGGIRAELVLDLPAGGYKAEWIDTKTGNVSRHATFTHPGGGRMLVSPDYSEDIALRVQRHPEAR